MNKSNLQDFLEAEQVVDHCHQSSFEGALRNIFDKGEFFCNRCMEILANYVDLDRLVSPELDPERLYPTKQNQKAVLSQVSLKTYSLAPSVLPPRPRESAKRAAEPVVPAPQQPPIESVSIFQNEKFQKLCALLEKSLEHAAEPKPQKPILVRDQLEDHILGDRIRELSEDLRTSQRDLKEHQIALERLAGKYKVARSRLMAAEKTIGELHRQASQSAALTVGSAHPG